MGGKTVEREGVWASKKEAREKVAELGTEVVRGLDSAVTGAGRGSENWVGRLGGTCPHMFNTGFGYLFTEAFVSFADPSPWRYQSSTPPTPPS